MNSFVCHDDEVLVDLGNSARGEKVVEIVFLSAKGVVRSKRIASSREGIAHYLRLRGECRRKNYLQTKRMTMLRCYYGGCHG